MFAPRPQRQIRREEKYTVTHRMGREPQRTDGVQLRRTSQDTLRVPTPDGKEMAAGTLWKSRAETPGETQCTT